MSVRPHLHNGFPYGFLDLTVVGVVVVELSETLEDDLRSARAVCGWWTS